MGVATFRRAELAEGQTAMTAANQIAIRRALESAGVEFIDENGGGPGVRLRGLSNKGGCPHDRFKRRTKTFLNVVASVWTKQKDEQR